MFYLIRHGKTDYTQRNTKIYQGFGANLAKLSELGERQILQSARDLRLLGADLILSSPYTRALQTAAILSRALDAPITVETDLHEWLANRHYCYEPDETAEAAYRAYVANDGRYPPGEAPLWESAEMVRRRALGVLERYACYPCVVVACHGMMIQAVTGGAHPACGEIVEFAL